MQTLFCITSAAGSEPPPAMSRPLMTTKKPNESRNTVLPSSARRSCTNGDPAQVSRPAPMNLGGRAETWDDELRSTIARSIGERERLAYATIALDVRPGSGFRHRGLSLRRRLRLWIARARARFAAGCGELLQHGGPALQLIARCTRIYRKRDTRAGCSGTVLGTTCRKGNVATSPP